MATTKIPNIKIRHVDDAYAIHIDPDRPGWEWRVLKHYQSPQKEKKNRFARVFCAVKSPLTRGQWEYGDTYIRDIGKRKIK